MAQTKTKPKLKLASKSVPPVPTVRRKPPASTSGTQAGTRAERNKLPKISKRPTSALKSFKDFNDIVIPPVNADNSFPPGQGCQEASLLSGETYIMCGRPASVIVIPQAQRGGRAYYMCSMCADHNIRNRNGKEVNRILLDRSNTTAARMDKASPKASPKPIPNLVLDQIDTEEERALAVKKYLESLESPGSTRRGKSSVPDVAEVKLPEADRDSLKADFEAYALLKIEAESIEEQMADLKASIGAAMSSNGIASIGFNKHTASIASRKYRTIQGDLLIAKYGVSPEIVIDCTRVTESTSISIHVDRPKKDKDGNSSGNGGGKDAGAED